MPFNRTRAAALAATTLALLLPAVAEARTQSVPLPPAGWTVVRDEGAVAKVRSDSAASMAYAYADVAASRIVTCGPLDRYALAHEVGHLFDWHVLTDADRAQLAAMLHAPAGAWFDWTREGNGAEVFADYYAAAAIGLDPRPRRVRGGGLRGGSSTTYARIGYVRLQRFRGFLAALTARDGLDVGRIAKAR